MKEYIEIIELIKECGAILLRADRFGMNIDSKSGSANFVTEYDTLIQEKLKDGLLNILPEAIFLGEEGDQVKFSNKGKFFIVDPIDGTTNFIKDYRVSCISVALLEDGVKKAAFIYNPYLDEMFTAYKGKGAFLNERRIGVSKKPLSEGIVLFGAAPYYEELNEKSFKTAYEYFKKSLDIRRSGSAALDLCSIACGRAELYFELKLSPWDYAAGSLIVEEAGGIVTTFEGDELTFDKGCSVLARNFDEEQ